MNIGFKAVFLALLLSAVADSLFVFITPFYLTSIGISLVDIGIIFSTAAFVMVLISVVLGAYTDIKGRKTVFASSFLVQSISSTVFPFVRGVLGAIPTKILHEFGLSVRQSLRTTIIFENTREAYQKIIAWISGAELLVAAGITLGAASVLSLLAYSGSYYLMAAIQMISFSIVFLAYREKGRNEKSKISLKDMYDLDLKRNMWVLMISGMLNTVGFTLSHGFAEPLYWEAKYGLSKPQIGAIVALHRLSLGIPLLFTGTIMHKVNVRKGYMISTFILSIALAAMGLINNVFLAIPIWLLHDVFGGSIQVPTGETLTQLNARDDKRGKDTNTILLLTRIFSIVTPSLTGSLITMNWDLIFLVGGTLTLFAALVFFLFYKE